MAGRVLSKKNESALRNAAKQLADILALLDSEDEDASDEAKEARRQLQEAANLGNWLESRIHLAFTQIADELFGGGRLNRQERIALSGAIGEALTAFNESIKGSIPDLYTRSPWSDAAEEDEAMQEAALDVAYIPLVEQALRADGTALLKLIEPGWGSSGYYPRDVLERDGPKVFTRGLKQFWNHATATEEAQRPEGDLNALAAELISDARWQDGPDGAGLYADAKIFSGYQEAVNELAPHIGVSIRAMGRAVPGEAEGRKGPIVEAITSAKSVDFVTEPGAGGKVIQMFEAARQRAASPKPKGADVNEQQFKEAISKVEQENARLREGLILRDAKDQVRAELARTTLPDVTKARLLERLAGNPPVKEGQLDSTALTERVTAAVADETQYLAQAAGYGSGRIEGMGGAAPEPDPKQQQATASLAESLQRLGIGKEMATQVADDWR